MKSCNKFLEMISAYIDNELSRVDKIEFDAHIEKCDKCREELFITRQMVELCHDMDEDVPNDFSKELRQKLDNANACQNGKKPIIRYMRTVSTIAASLIIVATLGFAFRFILPNMGAESAPEFEMKALGDNDALDQSQIAMDAQGEETKISVQFSKEIDIYEDPQMSGYKIEDRNNEIHLTFTETKVMNDTIVKITTSDVEETILKIAGIYEVYFVKGEVSKEIVDPSTMVSETNGVTVKTPYLKIIQVPLDKIDDFLDDLTKIYDKITIESIPAKDVENSGLIHILINREAD